MTIPEAFKAAAKQHSKTELMEIYDGLDENTNPTFRSLLISLIAIGGVTEPGNLLILLAAVFHAGTKYGESKSRAEFTDPFKELGEMPRSDSRNVDEWKKGVPGHPDNDMGM